MTPVDIVEKKRLMGSASMGINRIDLASKLGEVHDHFTPRVIAELNGQQVTEHRPVADEEVEVLLFEPASTLNTGDVSNELTVPQPEWL